MKLLAKRSLTVFSAVLSLLVCVSALTPRIYAADIDVLTESAAAIIYSNEGSYSSVNPNDNGAVSIGKVQWHASRALSLLKTVVSSNESQAKTILGSELYNEIKTTSSNWSSRTFSDSEAKAVSKLLDTAEGRAAQDSLAKNDIKGYIQHGMKLGITDEKALVYFADIENQAGYGGVSRIVEPLASKLGGYDFITLDNLHEAVMASYYGRYTSRRTTTYSCCSSLVFGSADSDIIGSYSLTDNAEDSCTLMFYVNSDSAKSAVVYVRASSSDNSKSYSCIISDHKASVKINASDIQSGEKSFTAKIMVFGSSSEQPIDVKENIQIKLASSSEEKQRQLGDIDNDGRISASDARLLLRYTAKLENLDSETLKYSDVNSDGRISAADARLLLRVSAKLETLA